MLFIGYRWLDDRIAIRDVFDDVGSKYVPPHVNIFYCFGGLVFTSFIAQVTTGAAMTFYYVPEVSRVDTNRRIAWFRDLLPYKTAPDRQLRAKLKVVVCARCLGNPRGRRVMRPS